MDEVNEELAPWVTRIVELTIEKHKGDCPLAPRVRTLELRFAVLIGYMVGSGLVGGVAGGMLIKLIGVC